MDELWMERDVWLSITIDNRSILLCSQILCEAMRAQVELNNKAKSWPDMWEAAAYALLGSCTYTYGL